MKLTRHTNRCLARLLMGLVLFAQGVVSANVYAASNVSPMQAIAAMPEHEPMPCHEEQAPGTNGCLTHCSQTDQVNIDHAASLAAPVSTATWQAVVPAEQQHIPQSVIRRHVALDTGPPIPIRFCSFLI